MDEFNTLLQKTGEYGVVYQISHPIVFIDGLPNARMREIILFETGQKGEIFTINRGKVEARVFSKDPVKVGTKVTRTDKLLSIPVGKEMLGHVVNPLGEPLDTAETFIPPKESRELDAEFIGIAGRQKITTQMITGISLIDLLLPLGRGQRELIIGDRKTGKTSILMTIIKNQIYEGVVVVYAAIAKKKSEIKKLQEYCVKEKLMDKMVIVATSSYYSPSLVYQTPYAAMTIAEYFRDQGINSLVILDDLSTHAKYYREVSLLAKRFPGRGSYPGDIFYTHSSLLERAGNFKHPTVGEVAISCLPVMEIIDGDLTGYISTNVMGITDGHIYIDSNIYYQGMRPAVNIPISVTRVGRQTLDKLSRDINKILTAFLADYGKLQNVSHFGQELSEDVKKTLKIGDLINKFFNQHYQVIIPKSVQLIMTSLILQGLVSGKEQMEELKKSLVDAYYNRGQQKLLYELTAVNDAKELNEKVSKNKDAIFALMQPDQSQQSAKPAPATGQAQNTTQPQPTPNTTETNPATPPASTPAPAQPTDNQKPQSLTQPATNNVNQTQPKTLEAAAQNPQPQTQQPPVAKT